MQLSKIFQNINTIRNPFKALAPNLKRTPLSANLYDDTSDPYCVGYKFGGEIVLALFLRSLSQHKPGIYIKKELTPKTILMMHKVQLHWKKNERNLILNSDLHKKKFNALYRFTLNLTRQTLWLTESVDQDQTALWRSSLIRVYTVNHRANDSI